MIAYSVEVEIIQGEGENNENSNSMDGTLWNRNI